MKTTKTHSQTDVPSQKSAMPVPNARWVPTRRPATVKPKAKDILFPKDAVAFGVSHHCMNPLIREGQQVFAVPHAGYDLPVGTPVVVASRSLGNLCKLWRGVSDGRIILGFLNGEDGKPGEMSLPLNDVTDIWKILGVWYDDVLPDTEKTPRNTQSARTFARPSAPQSGTSTRSTVAASAKSTNHVALTDFGKVKDRIIFTRTGKPIGYYDGEPGIKQLAWLVKKLLRLPVEGIEVENKGCKDHFLAFTENAPSRELTDEQLGAIKAFRWYCNDFTIGPYRRDTIVLSVSLFRSIPGSPSKDLLIFADESKAKKCCETIKDIFGFNAAARPLISRNNSGWVVWIDSHANGNRTICGDDLLRLEGVCALMVKQSLASIQDSNAKDEQGRTPASEKKSPTVKAKQTVRALRKQSA